MEQFPYPVRFSVNYPDRALNRLTTFFRLFVAIPILIVLGSVAGETWRWTYGGKTAGGAAGAGGLLFVAPLLMIVFRQKYPRWWFDWNLELLRFLNRVGFPAAFLGENIAFEEIDDVSARVTLTDHGKSVTGTLSFDDQGRLTNFTAERYATVDGGYELRPWSIPVTGYGQFEGLRLPVRGSVTWTTKDGDFVWLDLHVTKLEYNTIHVARTETESKTKQGTR